MVVFTFSHVCLKQNLSISLLQFLCGSWNWNFQFKILWAFIKRKIIEDVMPFLAFNLNKLVLLVKGYLTRMWQYPFPFNCYVALSISHMDLKEHTSLSRTRFVWESHNILS
jgi:hypothetical protein